MDALFIMQGMVWVAVGSQGVSLLEHEVATRTWGRKNVNRDAGWVTPE